MEATKICVVCGQQQSIDEFPDTNVEMCSDGKVSYCKACAWDLYYGLGELESEPKLKPKLKRQREQLDRYRELKRAKQRERTRLSRERHRLACKSLQPDIQ
jgi:hypothetical protein